MQHRIAYLQYIVKSQFPGHVTDMYIVPVLGRVKQIEVIRTQKLVGQQRAAERETFLAHTVLFNPPCVLIWEVDATVFVSGYGRYQSNPRPYIFFERVNR